MPHQTLVIKSNASTVSPVLIPDLGFYVPPGGGSITITAHDELSESLASDDLRTLATDQFYGAGEFDSTLILNNGVNDIPASGVGAILDPLENVIALSFDFDFTEAPFKTFGTLLIDDEVLDTEVEILTPFDDAATLLRLTLVTAGVDLLPTTNIDPISVGTYHTGENLLLGANDQLRIVITPGVSTQGAGRINVLVRR